MTAPEPAAPRPLGRPERPPLPGRLSYLMGGALAPRYRPWVERDLMSHGWRHRQARRPMLLMLPFVIAFGLLPGQPSLRISIVAFLALGAVFMGYATSGYFRNRRLEQAGLPPIAKPEEDE